jgi:hypothetical protein
MEACYLSPFLRFHVWFKGRAIRPFRCVTTITLLFFSLCMLTRWAWGEGTHGAIEGIVVDASGAPIPKTQVTAENLGTGSKSQAVSDPNGHFGFLSLPSGNYKVKAEKKGFAALVRQPIEIAAGKRIALRLVLKIGTPDDILYAGCQTTDLNQYDAEILLYVLPPSEAVRHAGGKVAWAIEPATNQKDFYSFYVYDLKGSSYGSPTIGHFAVNKHTGEVWDAVTEEPVESEDLSAIERIIRKAHCIDENVLKSHPSSRPDVLPK